MHGRCVTQYANTARFAHNSEAIRNYLVCNVIELDNGNLFVLVDNYLNEWHELDHRDTHAATGAPWCLTCDDYARCGDWHPEA